MRRLAPSTMRSSKNIGSRPSATGTARGSAGSGDGSIGAPTTRPSASTNWA